MSLRITQACICCDVCEPACPNTAITLGQDIYEINPDRCTECQGHFDEPQCVVVCPVACIELDIVESPEILLQRFHDIKQINHQ